MHEGTDIYLNCVHNLVVLHNHLGVKGYRTGRGCIFVVICFHESAVCMYLTGSQNHILGSKGKQG